MVPGIEQGSIWKEVDHVLKQIADKISLSDEMLKIYESRKDIEANISPPDKVAEELVQLFIDLENFRNRIKNIENAHWLEHHQFYSQVESPVISGPQENPFFHM